MAKVYKKFAPLVSGDLTDEEKWRHVKKNSLLSKLRLPL